MATEDILINDGDGFVSLSELAAEQVDVELPISSADATVTLDSPSANTFTISTGGEERLIVDSVGNVTIKKKLKGDGNYTPKLELTAGYTVNVTNSRYYNLYASDPKITHREIIYDTDSADVLSTLTYGKDYDEDLPLSIPAGQQPTVIQSPYDYIAEVNRAMWCSSRTNADADIIIDCTTDANDPVLKVIAKGHIETSRIVGSQAPATDASIELGASATISTNGQERVTVNSLGDVGIGLSNPANALDIFRFSPKTLSDAISESSAIYYPGSCTLQLRNNAQLTGSFAGIHFWAKNDSNQSHMGGFSYVSTDETYAGDFVWTTRTLGASQAEVMRLTKDALIVDGQVQTSRIVGPADNASIELGAELLTSNHTPTQPNSIATKQTVDDKIWVGTTAEYNALGTKNPTTLYCLTD